MTRPIVSILDVISQQEVVREMNDEEYAQHLIDVAVNETIQDEQNTSE